ncbi:MAG: transcription termination factor Rho [Gemmatimonadaceae bacterium]|nr:transcription termination factor Rho [Gemmatimonadaceae bacterium]MCW5827161.1 transcription termination factor Rho [Gemmatimonadaceae bacterium]
MTDSPRTPRRGRGRPRRGAAPDVPSDADPYLESSGAEQDASSPSADRSEASPREATPREAAPSDNGHDAPSGDAAAERADGEANGREGRPWQDRGDRGDRPERGGRGRRGRRQRGRGRGRDRGDRPDRPDRRDRQPNGNDGREFDSTPPVILVVDGETSGWFDPARDAGFIRRAEFSYLNEAGDAWVPQHLVKQYGLRRGDLIEARTGRDARGRLAVAEIVSINGGEPVEGQKRPEFQTLTASYPDRRLTLETGRPAKGGPELTRRAIDLIAPIGFGQRALIVAPARAGKTMLMHAITEGIAINHPTATLLILLVDERPEEVSEAISWGVGEVVASSFDQPAKRHVEVVEMVIERSRRLVEQGKDVIIVLDSLTRMARAFNTAERGTGRTLSGGLDTSAMAKPKAFFGSARNILPQHGGGSLTIIATALVETGSRMDDVIFEEFKGTGNCEIKLDRSLAEKRIFPAFDIATSGTRREEKLYKVEQIDAIYTLRRGLQQMPPQAAMEWLIKRIAGTTSNDALLAGL